MALFTNTLPMTDREKAVATETYLEVENYIRHTVWGLVRRYGGDFEEMMAEASCVFVAAYQEYTASRSDIPFCSWLRNWITWNLTDEIRTRLSRRSRFEQPEIETVADTHRDWKPAELLEELSEDAKAVVKLVLETPADLARVVAAKGDQPRNFRSSIRDYLAGLGWTARRVAESFAEVARVLKD